MRLLTSLDSFDLFSLLFSISGFILVFSFFYGIIRVILSPFLPGIKGRAGERKVRRILDSLPHEYNQAFNDVNIPTENGGTAQIDHIVVTTRGIICIETKNYSGHITGNAWEKYWKVHYGNRTADLYNPLFQNRTHVKALCSLLSRLNPELVIPEEQVLSVIVFTGNATLQIDGDTSNIISVDELYRYVSKVHPNQRLEGFYSQRQRFISILKSYAKDVSKHATIPSR